MSAAFSEKFIHCTPTGSREEQLSRVGIVKVDFRGRVFHVVNERCLFEVSTVFGVVTVKKIMARKVIIS